MRSGRNDGNGPAGRRDEHRPDQLSTRIAGTRDDPAHLSMTAQRKPHPWRRRGDNGLRILSAIPIGYAVASLWAMALARILPGGRAEATVIGTLAAFAICAGAAMWAFAARSGWRALWTLVLAGGIAAGITALSIQLTGRL